MRVRRTMTGWLAALLSVGTLLAPSAAAADPDTSPPGPVTDLHVTATSQTSVALTWADPTDPDLAHVVVRRLRNGDPVAPTAGFAVARLDAATTSAVDGGLAPGVGHRYAVFAEDAAGNDSAGVVVTGTTDPLTWSAPQQLSHDEGGLRGVACVGSSFCLDIDQAGRYQTFDGRSWTPPALIDGEGFFQPESVACRSASYCIATDWSGTVWEYRGSVWSLARNGSGDATAVAASCATTGLCVVVFGDGTFVRRGPGGWTARTRLAPSGYQATSVSCPSSTFCLATLARTSRTRAYASTFDGSRWSAPTLVDTRQQLLQVSCSSRYYCWAAGSVGWSDHFVHGRWSRPEDQAGGVVTFSCASRTMCMGVTWFGAAETFNGSRWSNEVRINGHSDGLSGVSCGTPTTCVVIEYSGFAWSWRDGHYGTRRYVDRTVGRIMALQCPSSTLCLALDEWGNAWRYDGTNWTGPQRVDRYAVGFTYLSCAGPTFCVALDRASYAYTFNGTTWSAAVPAIVDTARNDISCAGTSFCMATGTGSAPTVRNAKGSWTATSLASGYDEITGVSCASATFCIAMTAQGDALRYDGRSFRLLAHLDPARARHGWSVSCSSATYCLAAHDSVTEAYDGHAWQLLSSDQIVAGPVDCVATQRCFGLEPGSGIDAYDGDLWGQADDPNALGAMRFSCATTTFCVKADDYRVSVGT